VGLEISGIPLKTGPLFRVNGLQLRIVERWDEDVCTEVDSAGGKPRQDDWPTFAGCAG
jgi:hypothetical protein